MITCWPFDGQDGKREVFLGVLAMSMEHYPILSGIHTLYGEHRKGMGEVYLGFRLLLGSGFRGSLIYTHYRQKSGHSEAGAVPPST